MKSNSDKGALDYFHKILNLIIVIYGLFIIFDGLYYVSVTSGEVISSSFSMLITIVHMFALLFILAGIKAIDIGIMAFAKQNYKASDKAEEPDSQNDDYVLIDGKRVHKDNVDIIKKSF
jgi:hypothetical protein